MIMSYDFAQKISKTDLLKLKNGVMIVDEAHCLKNPEAKIVKVLMETVKMFKRVLLLTGTPLISRTEEAYK